MTKEPPPVLFSMDEAYDFVVENLPDVVAATLTPEDVKRILAFQWEYFRQTGVSANGSRDHPAAGLMSHAPVLRRPGEDDHIPRRAALTGRADRPPPARAGGRTHR